MNIQFESSGEFRDFLMNCGLGFGTDALHGDGRWSKLKRIVDKISDDACLDEEQCSFLSDDDICYLWHS